MEGGGNGLEKRCAILSKEFGSVAPAREIADGYIDDILIGTDQENLENSGSVEEILRRHDLEIRKILDLLREKEWVARFEKCNFFAKEVEFLGHVLKDGQRKPAPGKLLAVEKWELPQTITGLRAFCGFANHYSSYIEKYSELAAPLQDKLRVNRVEDKAGSFR